MENLKDLFIENFNTNHLCIEFMNFIEEQDYNNGTDLLQQFMIQEFNSEFMYSELFDIFKERMNKEDLKELLQYMGHTFVDLDELKGKRENLS